MWPWEHLAIGYVVWSLCVHYFRSRKPTDKEFWLVVFGTQFPDLVDKPLAWSFHVLPAGRSLAHSLITATLLLGFVGLLAREWEKVPLATAFGVGYISHLVTDAIGPLLAGDYAYTYYLLWPLLPLPPYDSSWSLLTELQYVSPGSILNYQSLVALAILVIWIIDDTPGIRGVFDRA